MVSGTSAASSAEPAGKCWSENTSASKYKSLHSHIFLYMILHLPVFFLIYSMHNISYLCKMIFKVLAIEKSWLPVLLYVNALSFRDGVPYCERDYQIQFGIQCEACQKFITGKVLEVRLWGRVMLLSLKSYTNIFCQLSVSGQQNPSLLPTAVLCLFQAGDKHYHPSCARCCRCDKTFTEGEEMYLQGQFIAITAHTIIIRRIWSFHKFQVL